VGNVAAKEFCNRWINRDALDQLRIRLDEDRSFTAVATPKDPAYALAGGDIRDQAVYSCPDPGTDPASTCIASPPSFISASARCDPTQPGIQDDGHHLVLECPQVVARITRTVRQRPPRFEVDTHCGGHRRLSVRVSGDTWAVKRLWFAAAGQRLGVLGHGRLTGVLVLSKSHPRNLSTHVVVSGDRTIRLTHRMPRC